MVIKKIRRSAEIPGGFIDDTHPNETTCSRTDQVYWNSLNKEPSTQKEIESFTASMSTESNCLPDSPPKRSSTKSILRANNNPNTTKFWINEKNFDNTSVVSKKLEQYTQRVYTNIYNGE